MKNKDSMNNHDLTTKTIAIGMKTFFNNFFILIYFKFFYFFNFVFAKYAELNFVRTKVKKIWLLKNLEVEGSDHLCYFFIVVVMVYFS